MLAAHDGMLMHNGGGYCEEGSKSNPEVVNAQAILVEIQISTLCRRLHYAFSICYILTHHRSAVRIEFFPNLSW